MVPRYQRLHSRLYVHVCAPVPSAWSAVPAWPLLPPALLRPQLQHAQGRRDCGVDRLDTLWVQAGYRGCSEYTLLGAGGWGLAHSQQRLELSSVNLFLLHKTTCPWESGLWAYCGIVRQLPPRAHPPRLPQEVWEQRQQPQGGGSVPAAAPNTPDVHNSRFYRGPP